MFPEKYYKGERERNLVNFIYFFIYELCYSPLLEVQPTLVFGSCCVPERRVDLNQK